MDAERTEVLHAVVKDGRLVVEPPATLVEGQCFELVPLEFEDALDEADREAQHRSLERGSLDIVAGRVIDADELLARLEARR